MSSELARWEKLLIAYLKRHFDSLVNRPTRIKEIICFLVKMCSIHKDMQKVSREEPQLTKINWGRAVSVNDFFPG